MGIRGASIELKNGDTVSVETESDDFTGELSSKDERQLVRELKHKIRDEYGNTSVELANGAQIVLYESATNARWKSSSFWDYFWRSPFTFGAPIVRYEEKYINPKETTLIESGAAHLYGTPPPPPEPSSVEATFFEDRLPDLIKSNKARFAQFQATFRIEVEEGATWIVKLPEGKITQATGSEGIGDADCAIRVSQSILKKVMKRDFSATSYLLDRPEFLKNKDLAYQLGWLLKELA